MSLLPAPQPEPEPVEGDLLDPDPHAITCTPYPGVVAWRCACGDWEGVATGVASARWVADDHARHVRAWLAARTVGDD